MSDHLKRLNAPDSWHIAKKTTKFITKTAPGPHNANAMPIAVWLRDHMGLARNLKEVKQILHQNDVIINGRHCRDAKMGIVSLILSRYRRSTNSTVSCVTRTVVMSPLRLMLRQQRPACARSKTRPLLQLVRYS